MPDHHCAHLLEGLSPYLDGEASAALCAEIEQHLAGCENCRAVVDTLRKTITLYHTLPQPDLPAGMRERLYRTLQWEDYFPPRP